MHYFSQRYLIFTFSSSDVTLLFENVEAYPVTFFAVVTHFQSAPRAID